VSYRTDLLAAIADVEREKQELADAQARLLTLQTQAVPDGIDVSVHNGEVDWAAVKAAGTGFIFTRTSHGDVRDATYTPARVAALKATGIPWAPYHFASVASPDKNRDRDGRIEAGMAIFFAQQHGWVPAGSLPLAYDFEGESINGQSAAKCAKHIVQFIRAYAFIIGPTQAGTPARPVFYTNRSSIDFVAGALSTDDKALVGECPLWIADPDDDPPDAIPSIWSGKGYAFHQFRTTGPYPGVSSANVDVNHFTGSATELAALRH
jgi:lysozyme